MAVAEVQNGIAVLYGIANDGSAITLSGYASFLFDSAKGQHKFDLETVKDNLKFDAALIAANMHMELDLTWVPTGATRAAVVASSNVDFPVALAKVSLAHCKVGRFNGDYVYIGDAAIDLSQAVGKMSLKVRKYDDSTQNASLTTTVAG